MKRPAWLLLTLLVFLLVGGTVAYVMLSPDAADDAGNRSGTSRGAPQFFEGNDPPADGSGDQGLINGPANNSDERASDDSGNTPGRITGGSGDAPGDADAGTEDPPQPKDTDEPQTPQPEATEPKGRVPDVVIGKSGALVLEDWSIRLAINRDGSRFAGNSKNDVFVYEGGANEPAWRRDEVKVWSALAMNPSGDTLVYIDGELRLSLVRLDGSETPWKSEVIWSHEPNKDRFPLVRYSADGTRIYLAHSSAGVQVLDPASGESIQTLETGDDRIFALDENATANLLVAVNEAGRVDLWALDTLDHLRTVQVGKLSGPDLVVEDDGNLLIESEPGRLARHSCTDGQRMAAHDFELSDGISHLSKLPGNRVLMVKRQSISSTLTIIDTQTFAELHSVPESMTLAIAISGDRKRMVTSTFRNELQRWRIEGDCIIRDGESAEQFLWAAWMPDGRRFLTAGVDGRLVAWDADTHTRLESWQLGDRPIDRLLVAPGGGSVLAVRDGAESTLLNFVTGGTAQLPLSDWGTHQFSADGARLWILTREGVIEFDGATGERVKVLLPEHSMVGFVVNPAQTVLVCAGTSLVAIDLPFTKPEVTKDDQRELAGLGVEGEQFVECMHFTRDGKTFVVALYDQVVIADVAEEKALASIKAHLAEVDIDDERGRLLLADLGGNVALHRLNGELIELLSTDNGYCAEFSPDGRRVIGVGRNRTVRIWKLD